MHPEINSYYFMINVYQFILFVIKIYPFSVKSYDNICNRASQKWIKCIKFGQIIIEICFV